jgi:hypothetical protein
MTVMQAWITNMRFEGVCGASGAFLGSAGLSSARSGRRVSGRFWRVWRGFGGSAVAENPDLKIDLDKLIKGFFRSDVLETACKSRIYKGFGAVFNTFRRACWNCGKRLESRIFEYLGAFSIVSIGRNPCGCSALGSARLDVRDAPPGAPRKRSGGAVGGAEFLILILLQQWNFLNCLVSPDAVRLIGNIDRGKNGGKNI